jgi:Flp pilus assembly protein TadD
MNFLLKLRKWLTKENIKKGGLVVALILAVAAGGRIAYLYDVSKKPQVVAKQLIVEGDNALNMGRYADAERIFAAEFKANRQNQKEALDTLYQQNPNDAYVNLFLGEFYTADDQSDKALQYYNRAAELNLKLAEAHYNLARLYDRQGNREAAKVESLKAIDISPTPKYRNNLATIYFKQLNYEEAIREYGRNKEYPLSSLESAKIYWRLEYLSQALSYQKQAVEWLEDETVMAKPENQEAWYFELAPGKVITLAQLDEKKSYAYYCLSVSLYLQGDSEGAQTEVQKLRDLNIARLADIKVLLTADLDALVQANASFSAPVDAYKQLYF